MDRAAHFERNEHMVRVLDLIFWAGMAVTLLSIAVLRVLDWVWFKRPAERSTDDMS